ncbi:hypothetical protein NiCM35_07720 [Niallia circulans]|jgi:hypothetical protein|uniref:hypothetical protein n=1 Tax=Niallia circulans TaxID=1397 RepID=UPI003D95BBD3
MLKGFEQEFSKNYSLYSELAEKRANSTLKLTNEEIVKAKAFQALKDIELQKIKEELENKHNQRLTIWKILFGSLY